MNKQPAISVIMSVYNQKNATYLEESILSVIGQSFADFEFIIYNDGSDEVIFFKLEEYARTDDRIILINNPVNQGLAYSLNACILAAKGKYLARMDDDDICHIHRFRIQYEYLENHPEIAFVGSNAGLIDGDGIFWGHRAMPMEPDKKDFLRFSPYVHPTVMIRRSVLEDGNHYNPGQKTLRCEDYELFMRLHNAGYRGQNVQQELFYYREDFHSYQKRNLKVRLAEMYVRYKNFKELGLLSAPGYLYVIRPLISMLVPSRLILRIKQKYHRHNVESEEHGKLGAQIIPISPNTERRAGVI